MINSHEQEGPDTQSVWTLSYPLFFHLNISQIFCSVLAPILPSCKHVFSMLLASYSYLDSSVTQKTFVFLLNMENKISGKDFS